MVGCYGSRCSRDSGVEGLEDLLELGWGGGGGADGDLVAESEGGLGWDCFGFGREDGLADEGHGLGIDDVPVGGFGGVIGVGAEGEATEVLGIESEVAGDGGGFGTGAVACEGFYGAGSGDDGHGCGEGGHAGTEAGVAAVDLSAGIVGHGGAVEDEVFIGSREGGGPMDGVAAVGSGGGDGQIALFREGGFTGRMDVGEVHADGGAAVGLGFDGGRFPSGTALGFAVAVFFPVVDVVLGLGVVDVFPGEPEGVVPGVIGGAEVRERGFSGGGQGMEEGFAFGGVEAELPERGGVVGPGEGGFGAFPIGERLGGEEEYGEESDERRGQGFHGGNGWFSVRRLVG
jgi:hypothetical protein